VTIQVAVGVALAALAMARAARGRRRRGAAACTAFAAVALVVLPTRATAHAPPATAAHARLPAASAAFDATGVVTAARSRSDRGVFRTEMDLATTGCSLGECPRVSHAIVWGGTIDGVTQVVGEVPVPGPGARVGIALERGRTSSLDGIARAVTRIDE
jgi:hypothetical protein